MKKITFRNIGQWLLVLVLLLLWAKAIIFPDTIIDFEAFCPFGGLQAISTLLSSGALACSMDSMHVFMGAMLALSAILVSKLFCGYLCPVGTIAEGFGRLGRRFKIKRIKIGGISDVLLRSLKYILLFITFYFTIGSNELFCRNYDPFFATVTLFGVDVTTWMATIAIILLIGGAIFFTQLWCRYLCPLGAISNAFKYFYVFIAYVIVLVVLNQAGISPDVTIQLALLTIIAYSLEIIGLRRRAGFQILRITRDETLCNDCKLCDKRCPQGIPVSELKVVNHPDCNLCTECLGHCPHEEAIGLNGSNRFNWLPLLITIVLVMTGFILGSKISIPTVDMEWGDKEALKRSKVFEMAGLKHVKCYGSSVTFADAMKKVQGITGVATHIRDHRVVVKYDSLALSPDQVRKALFTPAYIEIQEPENDTKVIVTDVLLNNFFDQVDLLFISGFAEKHGGIYSFQTTYGNPVKIRFFHNSSMNTDSLKESIEATNLVYRSSEDSFSSKGHFEVQEVIKTRSYLSGYELKSQTFPVYRSVFNNRGSYPNEELAQVIFRIQDYPRNQQMMHFIANHLGKANPYVVGIVSQYTESGPIAVVFYVREKTTKESVVNLMLEDMISISYDNGVREEIKNPYKFSLTK